MGIISSEMFQSIFGGNRTPCGTAIPSGNLKSAIGLRYFAFSVLDITSTTDEADIVGASRVASHQLKSRILTTCFSMLTAVLEPRNVIMRRKGPNWS
jgi:hypothetical protein